MMAMPSGAIYGFSIMPKVITTFRLLGLGIKPPDLQITFGQPPEPRLPHYQCTLNINSQCDLPVTHQF